MSDKHRLAQPAFCVRPTAVGAEDLAALPDKIRTKADAVIAEMSAKGCEAGGYRLTGDSVDAICCRRLGDHWRLITAFAAPNEVAILLVRKHIRDAGRRGPSDRTSANLDDVFTALYAGLDLEFEEFGDPDHSKSCCDENGVAPVAPAVVDAIAGVERVLRRGRRAARRSSRRTRRS